MTESNSHEKFEAAIALKLLNEEQLEAIRREQETSDISPLQIAIRKGYLHRRQLDLIDIFADPHSVVPGYRIDGFLGQGGGGTVYKATQLRMDRPVAIKTISRSAARNNLTPKRFEREAKIVGRLRHPNIISAFDFGIHNQQLYLVMEFVDGIDAGQLLSEQKRVPEFHAWHIAQQVCHALDNAKQHDVIHRDIKPGNLILTQAPAGTQFSANTPFVKVADFGLAKFNDKRLDSTITLENAISGTPFYMSPEQIKAEEIDHRSDIYSLGATIWHLITNAPPVVGTGPLDVISSKMKLEDEWLAEAPEGISTAGFQLLKKMCRHDREQRIDDYAALDREIETVIAELEHRWESDSQDFELVDAPYSVTAKVTTIQELAKTFVADGGDDENAGGANSNEGTATRDFDSDELEKDLPTPQLERRTESTGQPPKKSGWRLANWTAIAVGAILIPAFIYVALPKRQQTESGGRNTPAISTLKGEQREAFVTLDEFEGPPMMLFNGRSMDPTQKSSGTWEPAEGAEGGAILCGIGTREFRCWDGDRQPLRHFRFVCGFRQHKAAKIVFRLLNESEKEKVSIALWEVEIEKELATLKSGDEVSTCTLQQFDDEQNFGYHQFRLDSQPNHWRVEIDGELLGEIPKTTTAMVGTANLDTQPTSAKKPNGDDTDVRTVQLFVSGDGPAHFETLNFRAFKSQQ